MHDADIAVAIIVATMRAATPLVLAGFGELITERSGVLNLGVEGMMLVGAATGFIAAVAGGNLLLGFIVAMIAGALMALLFGVLTLSLMSNQVATGLALTIFGVGFSALIGTPWSGVPLTGLATAIWPHLSSAPPLLQQAMLLDPIIWIAVLVPFAAHRFIYSTRAGLVLRAVGESADVAHALGYSVLRIRYLAVAFGGAMSGLAGAYLSLCYTPTWSENMVAGRGWIALGLVVFSTWKPLWLALGSLLFGLVTIAQFQAEAMGINVSSNLLAMLPYLATVVVLVLISRDITRLRLSAPAALGRAFHAGS
jgi:simple sugar transport system permease protein